MQPTQLLTLWGKSDSDDPSYYHPLLFHMLDTAHVARLIWSEVLSPSCRYQLAHDIHLDLETAKAIISLMSGLHDLGKAHPGFQAQQPALATRVQKAGLSITKYWAEARKPHGQVTARELERILLDLGWERGPAVILAVVAGGHHGIFPSASDLQSMGMDTLGDSSWVEARDELVRSLAGHFLGAGGSDTVPALKKPPSAGTIAFLAGLITVADWIASSEHFPASSDIPLEKYVEVSRERAQQAFRALGWLPPLRPAGPANFDRIFSFLPNPVQQAVARAVSTLSSPHLLVVEAPMGMGKTEAALYAADAHLCAGETGGFYIALPTQATTNAMHRRVKDDYLAERGHSFIPDLQLVHANALLAREYDDYRLTSVVGEGDAAEEERASVQSWFAARKRTLLAPFGVGTIDQSLLAVLQTRHWFVRLFGLANKVVIFDEVHAYDTYMTAILERLLQWLAAVNATVVLLSATLPASRRERLVRAYAGDQTGRVPSRPYPRITWTGVSGTDSTTVSIDENSHRAVNLDFAPASPDDLASRLREALREGGCAAVVCNTVARAQEIYRRLEQSLADVECLLFHARTPFGWRRSRERDVLTRFGKGGERPSKAVLVATQVIEQSLDLDFDWMASEMAPLDLLLQRAGRLHRHRLDRPARVAQPRLTILCDAEPDGGIPEFGSSERVYARYILLRSWLALRGRTQLQIPGDIERLIAQVYDAPEPGFDDGEWTRALHDARKDMLERKRRDERKAEGVLVPPPGDSWELIEQFSQQLWEDEDPTIHPTLRAATRLGDPSVQVVCLEEDGGGVLRPVTGGVAVSLEEQPSPEQTVELMEASLALSHRGLFQALCDQEVPSGWRHSPHLRFHRHVIFSGGRAELAGWVLTIDSDLGLVIEKELA